MRLPLLLMGAGGHCRVILDLLLQSEAYSVAGLIDLKERVGQEVLGVSVIGTDQDLPRLFNEGLRHCFIAVGSVGDPGLRVKLAALAREAGFTFPNLIHPSAVVSPRAALGVGNFIAPGAIINVNAAIGDHGIVNTGAIIDHDCRLGDFVHMAPGAVLSGGVIVGHNTHIGTGTAVIQDVRIGAGTVIGAGSVVTRDISGGVVAYGNPCKEIRHA